MVDFEMLMNIVKAEGKVEVAKNMLGKGMDISLIAEVTGLTEAEIKMLRGVSEKRVTRACLRTPKTANFAEFSFHARRVWEGVPGVRQANGTKQGAKRR
ncbi:hypothetical protein J40TS1_41330 [Paenibacillus montaniterrae]|uniref:Uncharacterized protein n=1 Tax=Paenibacillus montaniterrae TaxID=429341 RepID=A0A919YWE1_9BACL|nr:hypothetical protein [Paenibacillus montaniterrae]GIP18491.1 hypothetical protein J40TS1_41330 [Paenibacillus montaniterrae]